MIFLGLTFQNHNTQYIGFILLLNIEWECIILLNDMIQAMLIRIALHLPILGKNRKY